MDLTEFTAADTALTTAVATVGAATVGVYVATKGFGFVKAWIGKLFRSAKAG